MIQIRKLREFTPRGETELKRYDRELAPDVVTASTKELFERAKEIVETIVESERYNLFYTLSHTTGGDERSFQGQDVIPFDIDGIKVNDDGTIDPRYVPAIAAALKLKPSEFTTVFSGNGLQCLVQLETPIATLKFFHEERDYYKVICKNIESNLQALGLQFKEVDPSAFAGNRLFRMPETANVKPDKPKRFSRILHLNFTPHSFNLRLTAGLPLVKPDEQFSAKQMSYIATDDEAVQAGCEFLKWAKANPDDVNEPQWYAALSIIGRFENGEAIAHEFSSGHSRYNEQDTARKLEQSVVASGPRTCANINNLWGECPSCPHFQKVTSPILIRGENFIATEDSGFHMLGARGGLIPQYEDLRRFFSREHSYKTNAESGMVYVFNGTHYTTFSDLRLRNFAHIHFDPHPAERATHEFCGWVNRTNHVELDWFLDSTKNKINFANGVLDLTDRKISEHNSEFGFQYCLPYGYDPKAVSPHFDKFMESVTDGDADLVDTLLEFVGYGLCDRTYWLTKGLLLVGDGANGKSTFLEIIQLLTGEGNYSSLSFGEMQEDTGRAGLEGMLLNIADELPNYTLRNTELFKKMMGGKITARRLYENGVAFKNTAKFIFACNEIPSTNDATDGLFRRLLIAPFNRKFRPGDGIHDPYIIDKIRPELPGIFNRVLRAFTELKKRSQITEGERSRQELEQYREQVDRVGTWIRDNIKIDAIVPKTENDGNIVEVDTVYERYVSECKASEEKPQSRYYFTRHLKRIVPQFGERYQRIRKGTRRPHVLMGVRMWDTVKKPKAKTVNGTQVPEGHDDMVMECDPKDMPRVF